MRISIYRKYFPRTVKLKITRSILLLYFIIRRKLSMMRYIIFLYGLEPVLIQNTYIERFRGHSGILVLLFL